MSDGNIYKAFTDGKNDDDHSEEIDSAKLQRYNQIRKIKQRKAEISKIDWDNLSDKDVSFGMIKKSYFLDENPTSEQDLSCGTSFNLYVKVGNKAFSTSVSQNVPENKLPDFTKKDRYQEPEEFVGDWLKSTFPNQEPKEIVSSELVKSAKDALMGKNNQALNSQLLCLVKKDFTLASEEIDRANKDKLISDYLKKSLGR